MTRDSREYLLEQQYANDANLAARQAIYAYQQPRVELAARALAFAELRGDETILDVGCGNGAYLAQLATLAHRGLVVGMDLSAGMLAAAGARSGAADLVVGDAQSLPFPDDHFDVALAMHMLYHVPDRARAVRELRRVTRPSGVVLVVTNSAEHLREIDDVLEAAGVISRPNSRLAFKMETGAPELEVEFASVERHDFPSALLVTDAACVVDYVLTMKAFVATDEYRSAIAAVRTHVEAEIERSGAFQIRTAPGCFVCR